MSLMLITDLHLDCYKPFSKVLANGMNSRLLDQLSVVKRVATCIEEEKPEAVLFLGDLFNGITESLPKIIYTAGFLTIQAWGKHVPIYILVGNHDIYRGMHVLSTFETLPNTHIISHTTQIKLDGYDIDMVPWDSPLPTERGDICVGHLPVNGTYVDANQMHICTDPNIYPISFEGYKYVLLGHFHNLQEFSVPNALVARYIGAIMQTDRRTSPSERGVTIFDKGELRLRPIESPKIYHFIINTNEDKDRFLANNLDQTDYFKITITSPEVDFPGTLDRVIVEYDLPEVVSSRLVMSDNSSGTWDARLITAVESFIDKTNTVLDKAALKTMAKELL
jgi:DNA repair exonuclease SbcCD nuclease subunit